MKSNKGIIFIIPAFILLSLFLFYPFIKALIDSFYETNLVTKGKFIGFNNYIMLMKDPNFWWTLGNSFAFIIVTPILMVISFLLALIVRDMGAESKIFRQLFFIPVITPIVVVGIIWRWLLAEDQGIINYLLNLLHINSVNWLSDYPTNLISVMIVTIWRGFGYYMMIFLAGLALIPKELEEAAKLDGANKLQVILKIILPNIKSTMVLVFITSSSAAIKIFTEIYIMIPGAPIQNKTLVAYLYNQSFEQFNFGYGSALGILIFLITLIFSFFNIRIMERNA